MIFPFFLLSMVLLSSVFTVGARFKENNWTYVFLAIISSVLIFEPQPMEYFNLDAAPSRLTRLREKLQQFSYYNIDRVVCLKFNQSLADLSPLEFVDNILLQGLAAKKIVVGDDFRFARNREGNYRCLLYTSDAADE